MPDAEDYRRALQTRFHRAAKRGSAYEIVSAGALYVEAGAKESEHQMPSCCSIMWQEFRSGYDAVLSSPATGQSPAATLCYRLPR